MSVQIECVYIYGLRSIHHKWGQICVAICELVSLDVLVRVLKVFPSVRPRARDVGHDPVHSHVLHLGPLLVTRVLAAQDPPPVVLLLKVARIASQLQNILVAKGTNLSELSGLLLRRVAENRESGREWAKCLAQHIVTVAWLGQTGTNRGGDGR